MGSEQGSIVLQNMQVDAVKMLVRAPTGQVSFLVGMNTSQSQTTTTKKGWMFDAVRSTLETHKTFTQSRIDAALEVETGRVVLQEHGPMQLGRGDLGDLRFRLLANWVMQGKPPISSNG